MDFLSQILSFLWKGQKKKKKKKKKERKKERKKKKRLRGQTIDKTLTKPNQICYLKLDTVYGLFKYASMTDSFNEGLGHNEQLMRGHTGHQKVGRK